MNNYKLWKSLKKLSDSVSDKLWNKVPKDASVNLDDYLLSDDNFVGCDLENHINEREAKFPGFKKLVEEAKEKRKTAYDRWRDEQMKDPEFEKVYTTTLQRIKKVDDFINKYSHIVPSGVSYSIHEDSSCIEYIGDTKRFGVCFNDEQRDTYFYFEKNPSLYSESGYLDCANVEILIKNL